MKRTLVLFATLGLLTLSAPMASAVNLIGPGLNNGDLDLVSTGDQVLATPSAPWHVVSAKTISGGFGDGASSEGFANVQQAGGFGLFFKPFQGSLTTGDRITSSLFARVNAPGAVPGATYTMTGWAGAGSGYIGLTDPTVTSQFAIDFYNAANTVLGTALLDLRTGLTTGLGVGAPQPPLATPNGNPFNYFNYTLTAVAPPGTASVAPRATMGNAYANPNGGDQAFVVDAFTLSSGAVPEPASLAIGLIGLVSFVGLARRR